MNAARFNMIADLAVELLSATDIPARTRALIESAVDELQKPEPDIEKQLIDALTKSAVNQFMNMFPSIPPEVVRKLKNCDFATGGVVNPKNLCPGDRFSETIIPIKRPSRMRRTYRLRGQSLIARVLHAPSYYVTLRKVVVFRRSALRHTINFIRGK